MLKKASGDTKTTPQAVLENTISPSALLLHAPLPARTDQPNSASNQVAAPPQFLARSARSIETENRGKNTTHTKSRQLAGESTMHVDLHVARSARSIEKKCQLSTRAGRPGHLLNSAALPLPQHRSPATRAPLLQRELLAT